jgi:hypothetical protein
MTIYVRQVYKIEVLYTREPGEAVRDETNLSLNELAYNVTEGAWSGETTLEETQFLSVSEMAEALQRQGSDPAFLIIPDEDGGEPGQEERE